MNKFYLIIVGLAFVALAIIFDTLPRPRVSELEKRELATFPEFSLDKLASGKFTAEVSSWFSDSEPFRDQFMSVSMLFKQWIALNTGSDDQITFHAADDETDMEPDSQAEPEDDGQPDEYINKLTAKEKAKIAHKGILVLGSGPNVRALMAYGGEAKGGSAYAQAVNTYQTELGDNVQVYCMVIPTAIEFYCPDEARERSKSQRATIMNIHSLLEDKVKPVDIYSVLGKNADKPIYLRTDHHWAPLGGFLAAQKLAQVAGVPFHDLSAYEQKVVHGYVGSMYGYSKDIAVKNAPEDFVYYVPNQVQYTTTYTMYDINKKYEVTGEHKPVQGEYFFKYKDGSGGAYCTFMGGDTKITKVETSTHNGRRVLILKDSFGNTIPSNLFYSFEQVHVVDYRYFTKNIKRYVVDNHITDVVFANNIFVAYNPSTAKAYLQFLKQ